MDFEAGLKATLRLLKARARSSRELSAALERKGCASTTVAQVMGRLVELGYVNDAEVARARAFRLLSSGWGRLAVLARLEAGGLEGGLAEGAVHKAQAEVGLRPVESARQLLEKRGLTSTQDRPRAARLLAARGFEQSVVDGLLGGE